MISNPTKTHPYLSIKKKKKKDSLNILFAPANKLYIWLVIDISRLLCNIEQNKNNVQPCHLCKYMEIFPATKKLMKTN